MTIASKSVEDTEPTEELEPAISEISLDDIEDTASATGDESAADTVALEIALLRTRLRLQEKQIA